MKVLSIAIAGGLLWSPIGVSAAQRTNPADKLERGSYSRDAVSVCSLSQSAPPIRIPSPDGKKAIVVSPDRDPQLPRTVLVVEAFGREFQAGFTWSPDCEVGWSPDSRAFFATYTMGGAVGGFVTQVFFVRPEGLNLVEQTKDVVKNFLSHPRTCFVPEDPNIGAIEWIRGSSDLLVAAETLPHSNCDNMGTFRAYIIHLPDGDIVKSYGQIEAKKLFWKHLGDELRNADDDCIRKPGSCDIPQLHPSKHYH